MSKGQFAGILLYTVVMVAIALGRDAYPAQAQAPTCPATPQIQQQKEDLIVTSCWWYTMQVNTDGAYFMSDRLIYGEVTGIVTGLSYEDGRSYAFVSVPDQATMKLEGSSGLVLRQGFQLRIAVPLVSLWTFAWPDGTRVEYAEADKYGVGYFQDGEVVIPEVITAGGR